MGAFDMDPIIDQNVLPSRNHRPSFVQTPNVLPTRTHRPSFISNSANVVAKTSIPSRSHRPSFINNGAVTEMPARNHRPSFTHVGQAHYNFPNNDIFTTNNTTTGQPTPVSRDDRPFQTGGADVNNPMGAPEQTYMSARKPPLVQLTSSVQFEDRVQ